MLQIMGSAALVTLGASAWRHNKQQLVLREAARAKEALKRAVNYAPNITRSEAAQVVKGVEDKNNEACHEVPVGSAVQQLHSMRAGEALARDLPTTTWVPDSLVMERITLAAPHPVAPCNSIITGMIVKPAVGGAQAKMPVVIWLHATGGSADLMVPRLVAYAAMGFLAVAVDSRYHGHRADCEQGSREGYQGAIFRAWRDGGERPFLLDTVRDLQSLLDHLCARPDVDASRIGMTGISLGGMHTWLCAALDERVAAAAPLIGVQSFGWAIEHDCYQGRVRSLQTAFDLIASAAGKASPDAELVQDVWEKLLPGLLKQYDSPKSLPCIAPRPLLVVNGAVDGRCPVEGLARVFRRCKSAYRAHGCPENFEVFVQKGVGHQVTDAMSCIVEDFFGRVLHPSNIVAGGRHESACVPRPCRLQLGGQDSCVVQSVECTEDLLTRTPIHRLYEQTEFNDTPV